MKTIKKEAGGEIGVILASDLVLAVNPRVTFRWSSRSADADNRSRPVSGVADESVGLSTLRAEERTLLALANGRRTIDELAELAGMPSVAAARHLRSLCDRGVLVPADKAGASEQVEAPGSWSNEMLAPRTITDALMSGPVEYDYASAGGTGPSSEDGVLPEAAQPAGEPGTSARRPILPVPTETTAPAAPPEERSTFPRKPASGPNVTLFWIPTPPEALPTLTPPPVGGGATGEATPESSGGSAGASASGPARKKSGEATVVVMGSPPGAGPVRVATPVGGSVPVRSVPGPELSPAMSVKSVGAGTADTSVPAEMEGSVSGAIAAGAPFRVGSYEVATRIAQGAMGSVYVCRRVGAVGFQRLFALKVIRQHSTQQDVAVKSFIREAKIGAMLDHPNLQTLVDVGTYEDQPFLILDYIEGTSLSDVITEDRRPPPAIVVSAILDILRGLQHVHDVVDEQGNRRGLVHCDVSPQNILIGVDGSARLTDFGSARFANEAQTAETDPVAVGKPAYMAPEQLRGESVDVRTDVFSVGIVMWTALTGQKLFSAESYDQTVMRVMRRKIPPPSELGAPACLDPIILKALSRSPEGRYASADELARDLLKVAAAENLVASPRDVGQWVRTELGDSLAERRRRIQEMFGSASGSGKTPGPGAGPGAAPQGRGPRPGARSLKLGDRTADGFERLPAPTIQINSVVPSPGSSAAASSPAPRARPRRAAQPSRSQWYLVIVSAVLAACALGVAIAYFVSSMTAPPKRPSRTARSEPPAGAGLGVASGRSAPPPVSPAGVKVPDRAEGHPAR